VERQVVVVCKLTAPESAIVNARKRNKARYLTHKIVCGEHATVLTLGPREDLAKWIVETWPMAFSGLGHEVHPNAKPVEQADRYYLHTLAEKFGDPNVRKRQELDQQLAELEHKLKLAPGELTGRDAKPKRGFFARLFGK
jgi:hypothetical protein